MAASVGDQRVIARSDVPDTTIDAVPKLPEAVCGKYYSPLSIFCQAVVLVICSLG